MTSIEWLIKELLLEDTIYRYNLKVIEQAKEMHKQEIIDAIEDGRYEFGYEYYNDTFVSKGSDDHISDISKMVKDDVDKLQQDAWDNYEHEEGNLYSTTFRNAFKLGYKKAKEHYELAASVRELKEYKLGFNCCTNNV